MGEPQSTKKRLSRWFYIFATLVTVFAQMAGVASVRLNADANVTVSVDKTSVKKADTVAITVGTPAGASKPTTINYLGFKLSSTSGLSYNASKSNIDGKMSNWKLDVVGDEYRITANSGGDTSAWPVTLYFTVTSDDLGASGITVTPLQEGVTDPSRAITIKSAVDATTQTPPDTSGTGSTTTDTTTTAGSEMTSDITSGTKASLLDHQGDVYNIGDTVDLKLQANLADYPSGTHGKEVGLKFSIGALGTYLKFDPEATTALLKANHYFLDGPKQSTDGTTTIYNYREYTPNPDNPADTSKTTGKSFQIFQFGTTNTFNFAWNNEESGIVTAAVAFKAVKDTILPDNSGDGYATITPVLMASASSLGATPMGTPLRIRINDNGIATSGYQFEAHDRSNGWVAGFPLYEMQTNGQLAIMADRASAADFAKQTMIRKAVMNASPYDPTTWGSGAFTAAGAAVILPFMTTNTDGTTTGSSTQFKPGTTYSLKPYNANYARIAAGSTGHDYYLPDYAPSFTLDSSGNLQLAAAPSTAKAKPDQFKVDNTKTPKVIAANLYHVKQVTVQTAAGVKVPNATVKMGSMEATTGSDGTGEMVPTGYQDSKTDPFYYPAQAPVFQSISFAANAPYTYDGSFTTSLSSDDKLSLTNAKNAAVSADGQTIILTVQAKAGQQAGVKIKKVDAASSTPLANATFKIWNGNATEDTAKLTTATDATGTTSFALASLSLNGFYYI